VGQGATVGGKDYKALVKGLDLSLAAADLSVPEREQRQAGSAAQPPLSSVPALSGDRSAWVWAETVLGVVALGGLAVQVWRRKSRHA
jgi:hypothetical protein